MASSVWRGESEHKFEVERGKMVVGRNPFAHMHLLLTLIFLLNASRCDSRAVTSASIQCILYQ